MSEWECAKRVSRAAAKTQCEIVTSNSIVHLQPQNEGEAGHSSHQILTFPIAPTPFALLSSTKGLMAFSQIGWFARN